MTINKEVNEVIWGSGLWVARPLTEIDVQFILAALEKWRYTAYYWLPNPDNEGDWQCSARFYIKITDRSTWISFLEQIASIIRFEMFTWIETGPMFESGLSKHLMLFVASNADAFLQFTQRYSLPPS